MQTLEKVSSQYYEKYKQTMANKNPLEKQSERS